MEENERRWERFKIGYRDTRQSYMHASISSRGNILINAFTMEKMEYPQAVTLYYDRAASSIGFRAETVDAKDIFIVTTRPDRGYGRISALSFLRYYGIKVRETIVSDYLEIDSTGMVILDLRNTRELHPKR